MTGGRNEMGLDNYLVVHGTARIQEGGAPELLQRLILGPLGMVDTGFSVPPGQQHRIAEPFAQCPETGQPVVMLDARSTPACRRA